MDSKSSLSVFEVKVYEGESLPVGAKIAMDSRLWVPGWMLHGRLESYIDKRLTVGEISLGFLDGEAVCIVCHDGYHAMAFCKKALRGNGYASKCVSKFTKKTLRAEEGITGSAIFWRKNNVSCPHESRYHYQD